METQQKMMHLRHKRTQKPCQQERTKQQWKDFTQNFQECNKKSNVSMSSTNGKTKGTATAARRLDNNV